MRGKIVKKDLMLRKLIAFLSILFLFLTSCEKRQEKPLTLRKGVLNTTLTLATIKETEVPVGIQGITAHKDHVSQDNQQGFEIKFSRLGGGVAYLSRDKTGFYIVHNSRRGRNYDAIGDFTLNDSGERIAYGAKKGKKWHVVIDGVESKGFDDVGSPVWSSDGLHVACEVRKGDRWHILLDNRLSAGCESYYEKPLFSPNSRLVLRVENTKDVMLKRFVISDLEFSKEYFLELRGRLLIFSPDNRKVAFVEELPEGKRLVEFSLNTPIDVKKGPFYDEIGYIAFGTKNTVAYAAAKGKNRFLVFNGKEIKLPDGDLLSLPVIRPDGRTIGIFIGTKGGVSLHQFFVDGEVRIKKEMLYESASDLVYSGDSKSFAYVARKGKGIFVVINGKEGQPYDMVVTPTFSPDGRRLVYRARKDAKRFVVVSDTNGLTIKQHKNYEMVFDTVFTEDGKSIAYGVKDGNNLIWKVDRLD